MGVFLRIPKGSVPYVRAAVRNTEALLNMERGPVPKADTRAKALELFAQVRQNLACVRPDYPADVILCPLCLRSLRREDLEGNDPLLTIEHILPEKAGGSWETLSCRPCNNTHGSAIDAHLVGRIRAHNALAGCPNTAPIHGTLDCEGGVVGITFQIVPSLDGQTRRDIRVKGASPDVLKRFGARLASGELRDISLTLSLDYVEERSRLGIIRVAYLLMFVEYGYSYILGKGPSVIRTILDRKMPISEHQLSSVANEVEPWELRDTDQQIDRLVLTAMSQKRILGHMVVFRVDEGIRRYFSVLLPARDERPDNVIAQL